MKLLSIYLPVLLLILSCQAKNKVNEEETSQSLTTSPMLMETLPLPDSFSGQEEQMPLKASRRPKNLEEKTEVTSLEFQEHLNHQQSQKLIRRAEVRMQVTNYAKSSQNIMDILKRYQAFVTYGTEERAGENLENTLQIKVGNNQFDNLLRDLTTESIYLERKSISVSDVTEEYIDNETRLKTKKKVEQRYLDLLQKAKTVKEILQIEEQVSALQEEIEATEAKQIYLNRQVAYSTIAINYYEKIAPVVSPDNNFNSKLKAALKAGWNGIGRVTLTLVASWPLLLAGGLFGFWLVYFIRKRKVRVI